MPTRAIAPIVGVSKSQVAADIEVSSSGQLTPALSPEPVAETTETKTAETALERPNYLTVDQSHQDGSKRL